MRILVTGASGFVGRELARQAEGDHELFGLRSPASGAEVGAGAVEWITADLGSESFTEKLPQGVDAIIHLAQSRRSREFPEGASDMMAVNVAATARLLEFARRSGVSRFVFASTATLYQRSLEPLSERAPLDCAQFYPATKRAAELLIGPYGSEFSCLVMRIFTVYGPGQRGRLVADLIERLRNGDAVNVEGARGLLLSPIHVADVAGALLAATAVEGPASTLNVGGVEALGIAEMATTIGALLDRTPTLVADSADEPGGYVAERTAFAAAFPGLPAPRSFEQGIGSVLAANAAPEAVSG